MSRGLIHTPSLSITDDESARLQDIYAKFQDPSSHYYLPPGTSGPEHEEDHSSNRAPEEGQQLASASPVASSSTTTGAPSLIASRENLDDRPWLNESSGRKEEALEYFRQHRHDITGVLTWPAAWGDQDSFQHVNNVQIVRWMESARIRYGESWAGVLGEKAIHDILHAKGMGIILKDISIKYKAPVTYPDTLMISNSIHSVNPERGSYGHQHIIWSLKDRHVKATGDSTIVMYDYDNLKKGVMGAEFKELLLSVARDRE